MDKRKIVKITLITVLSASCIYWLSQIAIQIYVYSQLESPALFRTTFLSNIFLDSAGAVSVGTLLLSLLIPVRNPKNMLQVMTIVSSVMGVLLFNLSFAIKRGLLNYIPFQIFQQPDLIVAVSTIGCIVGTVIGTTLLIIQICKALCRKSQKL